jgi:hypothetical protein
MPNPGTVSQSDIDTLEQGMKDLTSLGQQLKNSFRDINRETDVLGDNFISLIDKAKNNNDLASKYLISQKLQEATQNRINEIKSKSSFLDKVGLDFKREETHLQMRIAAAQIRSLQSNLSKAGIDNAERLKAIESLKIQNVLRGAELRYVSSTANNQSQVLKNLNAQLDTIEGFAPNLQQSNTFARQMKNIFGDTLGTMGEFGKILSGTIPTYKDIIEKGVKMFFEFDKAGFTLRKTFGFLRGDFDVLEKNIKEIAIDLADFGVTFESAATATSAIGKEFNALVASNKSIVKDVTMLSAQLGIAESESAKFLKTISSISGNTVSSQKGMSGFAKQMSNAAGVALPDVMKEIAESADDVRIYTGKSVVNLIKGTVEAKQMGTSFVKMVDTAKKLLDFNTSINDEMEASVLLGRDINFQRARELAFRKDVINANREILRIAQTMDFDAMDPFQAESFAKASGKTVAELQDMIQAEKEIQHIRSFGTAEQKKQLNMMDELKRKRETEAKDIGKQAEARLMQEANQERMNQLQNQFNKLMMELAKPVMDLVEPLLTLAVSIMPALVGGFKLMVGYSSVFAGFKFMLTIPRIITAFMGALKGGQGIIKAFSAPFKSLSRVFGPMTKFLPFLGKLGPLLAPLMKFAGPIGIVITAIQGVLSLFDSVKSSFKDFSEGKILSGIIKLLTAIPKMVLDVTLGTLYDLGKLILGWFGVDLPDGMWNGIKSVGDMLFEGILSPFKAAWDWIKSIFVGQSPSTIGLGIWNGIKSVGPMILDALTLPFRQGFNFISRSFGGPKLPSFSDMIGGKPVTNTESMKNQAETSTQIVESNKQVVDKLDELIGLMKSGGIAVNMDGSKVSTALGVATKFRGAY